MAKKNSGGGGAALIGLIVLGMIVKYWAVFFPLAVVGLIIWVIVKVAKSWSASKTKQYSITTKLQPSSSTQPSQNYSSPSLSGAVQQPKKETAPTITITTGTSIMGNVTCAHCNTAGSHSLLRTMGNTIEYRCVACGKEFFRFQSDSKDAHSDYRLPFSPAPSRSDATIFGAGAQPANSVSADSLWVPSGRTIQVAGYSIPGGMVYHGTGLKSVNQYNDEPALIRPNLKVDTANPDREGSNMGYWPSYSQIHPTSRAAFLEWLSTGRKDPKANIGYVFIFFYGLERRALADAKESAAARNEIPAIVTEVKRLQSIYGDNNSFRGYASKLLDALQSSQVTAPLYRTSPQIDNGCSWEIPLTLKIALGQVANDGVPLPVEWALAWTENDPSMPRRMPSQRCQAEYRELFKIRYSEKMGEGLKLKPNKARLSAQYRPASSSFNYAVNIPISDLPDVTETTGAANKIRDIANACTDELESYSRYLGRNPEGKNSIEATSYLPQPLLDRHAGNDFQKLSNCLSVQVHSANPECFSFSMLLEHIPSIKPDGFGKKEATAIANLLAKMKIGIEPDPRFGNFIPKAGQDVVLFKISQNAPNSPSTEYSAATVVLHLASAVASADGTVDPNEERHLEEHVETWLHLSSDEKTRLRAHTQWLLSAFPGMNGVKKRIEVLKQEQKESLGRFLVGVAQADGYIDPTEMKTLTKIYEMLGLDTQSLYSHAHAAAVEPVTVQAADFVKPQGYAIPTSQPKPSDGVSLDMSAIEAKLAETVAVSAILSNIFTDDEPVAIQPSAPATSTSDVSIAGLDPESFTFMQVLASKLIWAREELEKLAADHSLMLDGTLDSINDASFDHFGGPFFEGDDPIEINAEYAKEIAT
ncbi:MAG: Tellurite resistance protein TerB [Geobacter sp.]|nr:MAG: Tellurite resistance protein TerB [Geobacter sp.]